jgi:hypothetical protein
LSDSIDTPKCWQLSALSLPRLVAAGGRLRAERWTEMLAGQEGFEPPTCGFGDRCSASWAIGLQVPQKPAKAGLTRLIPSPYFDSRWGVCFRSWRQNFFSSSFSVMVFLFFVVV